MRTETMAECQTPAEFGYKDKKGSMEWFCAAHRLNEHYADARLPKPEQKTESKQVAAPLQFHPLAEIFPLIEGQEFNELVADIRAHGIREPIWIYDGRIIDGRNRYRAASAAGIECPVRKYTGADPVSFVISLNLKRRHLNESQRAMVAAKLATMAQGARTDLSPIGEKSQAEAAQLLNVGKRSVERAREVRERGAPELQAAVEAGAVSVSAALDVASYHSKTSAKLLLAVPKRYLKRLKPSERSGPRPAVPSASPR